MKILQFYVFKMAANEGRHFEINIKTENYKTQSISQKYVYWYTFDKRDLSLSCILVYHANNNSMVFNIVLLSKYNEENHLNEITVKIFRLITFKPLL